MVSITREQYGLIRTLSGIVCMDELDRSAQSIQSDSRLDEMHYNIHDFTGVTEVRLSDTDIDYMAARANVSVKNNPKLKIAFVGRHHVVFKLMEAFNKVGYSSNRVVQFDTLTEARAFACT